MQRKALRITQSVTIAAAILCAGIIGYRQWAANQQLPRFDWHKLPKEGFAYHDTHGEVPGNMENGVQELKKLYGAIQIFRKRHNGSYPAKSSELINDCIREPSAYGVKSGMAFLSGFQNPDNQYGDDSFRKPNKTVTVSVVGKRPDGTAVGGPKPLGTRDLVGMSDLYFHENSRIYSESRGTINPVGYFLLLWDDGTVEKLPYDKRLYVQIAPKTWQHAFPGQAGLPQTGVSTYDEWYKARGWKAGPRGVKDGPGLDGHTYNPQNGG